VFFILWQINSLSLGSPTDDCYLYLCIKYRAMPVTFPLYNFLLDLAIRRWCSPVCQWRARNVLFAGFYCSDGDSDNKPFCTVLKTGLTLSAKRYRHIFASTSAMCWRIFKILGGHCVKIALTQLLNIPPHLSHVTTLPREIFMSENSRDDNLKHVLWLAINRKEATCLRCGDGTFDYFITNLLPSLLWKSF